MMYVSNKSTSAVNLTTSDQAVLTVDVSSFPVGATLEITATIAANGDSNLTGLIAGTNVTQTYFQAAMWGRVISFTEGWVKTTGITTISLYARKDNAQALTAGARALTVKRVA